MSDLITLDYTFNNVVREDVDGEEKIDCAAIVEAGVIYYLPRPCRHHDILHAYYNKTGKVAGSEQGFLTTFKRYVTREEARDIAFRANQCKKIHHAIMLFSEDLW